MRRFLRISTQRAKGSAEGAPPDGVVAGDAANAKTKPNGNHPTPMGHPSTGGIKPSPAASGGGVSPPSLAVGQPSARTAARRGVEVASTAAIPRRRAAA